MSLFRWNLPHALKWQCFPFIVGTVRGRGLHERLITAQTCPEFLVFQYDHEHSKCARSRTHSCLPPLRTCLEVRVPKHHGHPWCSPMNHASTMSSKGIFSVLYSALATLMKGWHSLFLSSTTEYEPALVPRHWCFGVGGRPKIRRAVAKFSKPNTRYRFVDVNTCASIDLVTVMQARLPSLPYGAAVEDFQGCRG